VSTQPTSPIVADRSVGDAAALLPTATGATQPADHPAAGHVTAGEIAEFLRHLARFRSPAVGGDPADQAAALLARKAELFARIADQHARTATGAPTAATPTTATTPEGRTP
jgi:hypothetical protein